MAAKEFSLSDLGFSAGLSKSRSRANYSSCCLCALACRLRLPFRAYSTPRSHIHSLRMSSKTVLVYGGAGQLGQEVVSAFRAQGEFP